MPVQITIIGLGQIGASIGLSLAAHKELVITVGHDKDFSVEQRAKKNGVVNTTNHNLPGSVEDADMVILALPVHEIRDTFKYIAHDLKKDVVIVDTAPVKVEAAKWAKEFLPETAHYVGLAPAIGFDHLNLMETGLDSAKADLFTKSIFLLSAPSGTPGEAVKLVSDFVGLLGATAMMTDVTESDGLMASAHILPQLISAALVNATMGQPGWQEVRKAAGRGYFSGTSALDFDSAEASAALSAQNRENVIRVLNAMMNALLDLRDDLENQDDESLKNHLQSAHAGRMTWLDERSKANWSHIPGEKVEKISFMENLLGSKLGKMGKRKDE